MKASAASLPGAAVSYGREGTRGCTTTIIKTAAALLLFRRKDQKYEQERLF